MGRLRLITGPSGSGKSTSLYEEILKRARAERSRNFFFIVPDQAAMSVQKALIYASPVRGILNIDVLGFGRLSHRILEETGQEDVPVLDDTGMNLILQKVASASAKDLPYLGRKLSKSGYITEVKSALSEFMQYGKSPADIDEMIDCSIGRGALKSKLKDLKKIYELFEEHISGHYITRDEKLDILCNAIPSSSLIPDSVMIFDGFTGFTPVQMKVIEALMNRCSEMIFTLESSEDEDVREEVSSESLFYLSHKTANALIERAQKAGMEISDPEMRRSMISERDIALLEKNLFRKNRTSYTGEFSGSVRILEMADPALEARYIGVKIRSLIEKGGYAYRDFAIVCGDTDTYVPYFEGVFEDMGIPFFTDSVSRVMLNPLIETISAVLDIESSDYSPESVTRFLKGGLTGIDTCDIDMIDNYIRQTGIRGCRAWHELFTRKVRSRKNDKEYLEKVNEVRKKIIDITAKIEDNGKRITKDTASAYVERLYDLLVFIDAPEKIRQIKRRFEDEEIAGKVREYTHIWKMAVDLFDKIHTLIGDEEVTSEEFAEIVNAGIAEMRVPMIPQTVDRVLVGDITRSRLGRVKVLFIAGANDGNIPQVASSKGLISDLDREFLSEQGIELSPTPTQEMYFQRQYLYMNICKADDKLFVSYSRVRTDGKSVRPSYLIPMIKKILPYTEKPVRPECGDISEKVACKKDALLMLASAMRQYADLGDEMPDAGYVFSLYASLAGEESRDVITDSVYKRYLDNPLADEIVKKLYPEELEGSVSSFETYAGCPYRYFLNYGLQIKPTESFEIENSDRGLLSHDILKGFSDRLSAEGLSWTDFSDEYAKEAIREIAMEKAASYGSSLYYASKRNEYNIERLSRLALNSALYIRDQLKSGDFVPKYSEKPFNMTIDLDGGRKLRMRGVIDRVDIADCDGKKYIQIVDYKSGDKDISIPELMDGRQIQLPLYMYQEKEKTGGEAASMLYFHIQDPINEIKKASDADVIKNERIHGMRPKGELTSDPEALGHLDKNLKGLTPGLSSEYYPVSLKKDGDFNSYSRVIDPLVLDMLLDEAVNVVKKEAGEILNGCISIRPYRSSCKYCPYVNACGMDRKIPGYSFPEESKLSRKEALEIIIKKNEKQEDAGDGI